MTALLLAAGCFLAVFATALINRHLDRTTRKDRR